MFQLLLTAGAAIRNRSNIVQKSIQNWLQIVPGRVLWDLGQVWGGLGWVDFRTTLERKGHHHGPDLDPKNGANICSKMSTLPAAPPAYPVPALAPK